jgi:hypothetical protein
MTWRVATLSWGKAPARSLLTPDGREMAIMAADDKIRRIQGVLTALVIQARG